MGGVKSPTHYIKKKYKKMDKKFYEMPEIEVVDRELEGALLSDSEPGTIPGSTDDPSDLDDGE